MAKFAGKWKLESTENFDEYMKALEIANKNSKFRNRLLNYLFNDAKPLYIEVGFVLRKMGNTVKPNQLIEIDGDTWNLKTVSTFKSTEITFKLGEEFEETTADGRKCKTTITLDDNKLIQDQVSEIPTKLVRELTDDDTFKMTLECKGVTCTRVYKRFE